MPKREVSALSLPLPTPEDERAQVMVTDEHSLPEVLRFAESVYAHVSLTRSADIQWETIARINQMDVNECRRLWRYIAYHWKGPPCLKRSDVAYEDVDLGAESDPEGSITHAVPVAKKSKKGKGKGAGGGGGGGGFSGLAKGYIVFSRENWDRVKSSNPGISFGDIARTIGKEWQALPKKDKEVFVQKAIEARNKGESV